MDGWIDKQMDDEWMVGCTVWMFGCMHAYMDGRVDWCFEMYQ